MKSREDYHHGVKYLVVNMEVVALLRASNEVTDSGERARKAALLLRHPTAMGSCM